MNKMPVFIKVTEYKDIVQLIDVLRAKINQAKNLLDEINELKRKEEQLIEKWQNDLTEVENKIDDVDRSLLEPEME